MGVAMLAYASGNVVWSLFYAFEPAPPYPSPADALWILFYPAAYVAVILLVRTRTPHLGSRLWLDGVIALLVACAISAAVVVEAVREATGGATVAVVTSLAYPVGDMILTGLVIGTMAAGRGKLDRTWLCLSAGVLIFAAGDGVYGYQVAEGT